MAAACRFGGQCAIPSTGNSRMPRKIVARRSAIHGNGVFAVAPIAKGERVIEYKGRRRTHADVDAGESGDADSGHTFLFTLNDQYVIDANFEGNSARWINHSCKPNCEAVLDENEADAKKSRVYIEAIRAIKPGDILKSRKGYFRAWDHQLVQEAYPFTVKAKGNAKDKWDFLALGTVGGDLGLHTGGGSIKVRHANGKVVAETGGGSVEVEAGAQGAAV